MIIQVLDSDGTDLKLDPQSFYSFDESRFQNAAIWLSSARQSIDLKYKSCGLNYLISYLVGYTLHLIHSLYELASMYILYVY